MANYQLLKADIDAKVYQNGAQEITGENLNSVLNAMVTTLGAGYQFMGVATPTNPGTAQTPDYKCFYLATTPGTYTYLGGLVVADGEVALLKWDTAWTKEVTGIASADKLNQLGQEVGTYNNLAYSSTNSSYRIKLDGNSAGASNSAIFRINSIPSYYKRVKINSSCDSNSLAIAFYSSNNLASSTLIGYVVGKELGIKSYYAEIPSGTVMIAFTHNTLIKSIPDMFVDDGGYIQKSKAAALSNVFGNSKSETINQDLSTKYLLDSIITEVSESAVSLNMSKYNVVRGIFNAQGQLQADSSRVVNSDLMDIRGLAYFSVTPPSGCKYNIAYYATPDQSSFIALESSTWINVSGEYRAKGLYMRIQAMDATSPTAIDIFDSFTILGYSRKIGSQSLDSKIAASDYEGDAYPTNYTFVQGVLINGVLDAQNTSYISSRDYINIGGLRSIKVINDTGYKSAVVLYDDNKNFVIGTPAISDGSYMVDVAGYHYIKMVIGKANGGDIKDGEIHITMVGIKERAYNVIDVSRLYYAGSIVNGVIQDASTRISTKQFIDVRTLNTLRVNVASGYYYAVVYYTSNSEETYIGGTSWSNTSASFDVSKYNYARVTIRRSDNGDILATDGVAVSLVGYKENTSTNNRTYDGARISLKNKMTYKSIWDKFTMLFSSAYSFDEETQQGSAIYNGYLFMLRHHAVVDVVNLNTMSFVNEYVIEDISAQKPHCNSGSFSKLFPANNTDFPYLYTGRTAYGNDSQGETDAAKNCCYVLNVTTTSAALVQTITFANNNGDYYTSENGGAWDWFLDPMRNVLYTIGYGGTPRAFIIKEFNAPDPTQGGTIQLTDDDVIGQWEIADNYKGISHAFQGATIYGNYLILPISRGDETIQDEAIQIFDKISHAEIADFTLVESEVGEAQSVSVWDGKLWLVSKNGRLDCIDFDA